VEAYVWLSLALENGARGRALDSLVTNLDASTLAVAQKRLNERRAALGTKPAAPKITRTETPAPTSPGSTPTTPPAAQPRGTEERPAAPITPDTPARASTPADFDRQVEDTLNKVNEQKAALEKQLAAANTDKNQLSTELAAAWKEAEGLKTQLARE